MSLRPLFSAALIVFASVLLILIVPSAQAATPGSVQVTGNQLKSALLPASDFGSGYKAQDALDSGNALESSRASFNISTMKCSTFVIGLFGISGFGESAVASESDITSRVAALYQQVVYQFRDTHAGESFYEAAYAKYGKCGPATVPAAAGGGTETTRTQSVSRLQVDGHTAFEVVQSTTYSNNPGDLPPLKTFWLFTIDGTDTFIFESIGGSAAPLARLMTRLTGRVSALR